MIKNISFDLWLTLIRSHPQFKKKRAEFLWKRFNPRKISLDEIVALVQSVDKQCDRDNEAFGFKIPAEKMYERILLELQFDQSEVTPGILREIKLQCYKIFRLYPPVFLNDNIKDVLYGLNQEGYYLNLSSNTGFIESDCLVDVLKEMDIYRFFQFCIFSDEINASKPSGNFFKRVFENISNEKNEVIHIGDNYQADFLGAQNFGFHALLIQNEDYNLFDIKEQINEKNRNV